MPLSDFGLFTPLFDQVVLRHNLVTAAVYGLIWRYCQMSDGVCKASLETLSSRLGLSRMTLLRHLDTLTAAGFLTDRTPTLRNRPHIYIVNRPPADQGEILGISKLDTSGAGGISELDSTVSELDTRYPKIRPPGVSQSDLNRTLLRDLHEPDRLRDGFLKPEIENQNSKNENAAVLWNFIIGDLAREMNKADYSTWIQPAIPRSWNGVVLEIVVINSYARDWLTSRILSRAQRTLQAYLNSSSAQLIFLVAP